MKHGSPLEVVPSFGFTHIFRPDFADRGYFAKGLASSGATRPIFSLISCARAWLIDMVVNSNSLAQVDWKEGRAEGEEAKKGATNGSPSIQRQGMKNMICTLPITKSFRCKWMYYCRVFNDIIE